MINREDLIVMGFTPKTYHEQEGSFYAIYKEAVEPPTLKPAINSLDNVRPKCSVCGSPLTIDHEVESGMCCICEADDDYRNGGLQE